MKKFVTLIIAAIFCASYSWAQESDCIQAGVTDTAGTVAVSYGNDDSLQCGTRNGKRFAFDQRRGSHDGQHAGQAKPGQKAAVKNHKGNTNGFRKEAPDFNQIMSQKIAFFTKELDLSTAEAEKFWPVYNEYSKAQCAAHAESMKALKVLKKAIRSYQKAACANDAGCKDGKANVRKGQDVKPATEKEIDELAQKYIKAQEQEKVILANYYPKFKNVLPVSKAAKIFSIEEKFRSFLIKGLKKH